LAATATVAALPSSTDGRHTTFAVIFAAICLLFDSCLLSFCLRLTVCFALAISSTTATVAAATRATAATAITIAVTAAVALGQAGAQFSLSSALMFFYTVDCCFL
jgi:hypothetical protein